MSRKTGWITVGAVVLVFGYSVSEGMSGKSPSNLNIQAVKMYDEGHYDQALALEEEAVEIVENMPFYDKEDYATFLANLSIYYKETNGYEKAFATALKSYTIRKKIILVNNIELAGNCLVMGEVEKLMDKDKEALEYFQEALLIYQKNNANNHDMGNIWAHIGGLHKKLGNYEESKKALENAIEFHKKLPKDEMAMLGTTLRIYGEVLFEMESYDEALKIFNEALAIDQKYLDKTHPDIGIDYNDIGAALYELDDIDGAIKNYQNALKIQEKILGKNHTSVAVTLNNIADLYRYQEQYDKAIVYFNRAIEIETAVYGRKSTTTAITISNLALAYKEMGQNEKALALYSEILEIREKGLPKGHPDTLKTINKLIGLYELMDDSEKIQQMQEKLSDAKTK
jgi:tetratricopeptide (TPR) repeat protein